jgi:stearoyl-CoA desaturase (delta-9 desaturase)
MQLGQVQATATDRTLEGLIANRYEIMAQYAKQMRAACGQEMQALQAKGADLSAIKTAKRWLHRDDARIPATALADLQKARSEHPVLDKMASMRDELQAFWGNTSANREQLIVDLQAWCQRAEASGIDALRQLSLQLKSVRT